MLQTHVWNIIVREGNYQDCRKDSWADSSNWLQILIYFPQMNPSLNLIASVLKTLYDHLVPIKLSAFPPIGWKFLGTGGVGGTHSWCHKSKSYMQVQGAGDGCIFDNLLRQFSSLNIKILEINKIWGKKFWVINKYNYLWQRLFHPVLKTEIESSRTDCFKTLNRLLEP